MTRKEFLRLCGLFGLSLPLRPLMASSVNNFRGKVLIIGAGAAGMASGYLLKQLGVDFEIIEASNTYGGRIKKNTSFVDFPLPLGGEWLHVNEKELSKIVNNSSKEINTELKGYGKREKIGYYEDGELSYSTIISEMGLFYNDKKFVNSTWLGFFEKYLLPSLKGRMRFNSPIASVNYQSDKIILTDKNGKVYRGDKVIVTIPLKQLQRKAVSFVPVLPKYKTKAIQEAHVWGGMKVFTQFSEKFYPAFLAFPDTENDEGQRVYYDAAYGQKTKSHILGLFSVGKQAEPYQKHVNHQKIEYILNELDEVFDGKASKHYQKHIVQNWNKEPYINGAYLADVEYSYISKDLSYSINDKVYFAGTAYTRERDWGGVHNATRSARDVVKEIMS